MSTKFICRRGFGFSKVFLTRSFSYKPIKRPNFKSDIKTKSKSNVLQENNKANIAQQIKARIQTTGPITVANYMKNVLTNPSDGYYMSRDVFGQGGDFITSPEIGQIFGEIVAVWCLSEWQKIGCPSPLQIVELGPGRGTLVQDVLRVLTHFGLSKTISLHLVEISPFLSKQQAHRLCYRHGEAAQSDNSCAYYYEGETISGVKAFWYRRIEDVPRQFSIVLAHEFFDAMPIHKFQKADNIWKEVLIDLDPRDQEKFRFIISRMETPASKLIQILPDDQREHIEISFEMINIIDSLASRHESDGGFSLIMDYGHFGNKTDTFRAFRNHKLHDPLSEPGSADLTADVDFRQIKTTAEKNGKVLTYGPIDQGDFIKRLGGDTRIKILTENAQTDQVENLKTGYEMLTHPDQMGCRFKFFSIFPAVLKNHFEKFPPAGFIS